MLYQGSSSQISAQSRNNSPHERLFTGICLWGDKWFVNPLFASKEQPSRLMLIRDLLIGGGSKEFANTQALQKPSSQHDNSPHECCSLGFYYAIEISEG